MEDELWRQCVRWLIDVGVLPNQHKTTFQHAQIFDLAQTLRDGVVLCNLLNVIKSGVIGLGHINIGPHMLQFLCLDNIRTVLNCLRNSFGFDQQDLFLPHDLYNMTNFRQVLRALSLLSHLPVASSRFRPFPSESGRRRSVPKTEDEEIYRNLPDLASERELVDEENLYDTVPREEKEEGIYGTVVGIKKPLSPPKDKRSHCVNEIIETERNYVNHLEILQHKFIDRLRGTLDEKDIRTIFSNLEQLLPIHKDFLKQVENAVNNNMMKLSQPFLKFKDRFLQYGVYCSNLQEAIAYLAHLMKNEHIRAKVEECQNNGGPNKFKLRELLFVSMQRILKYHLLVKELNKYTSDSHADKVELEKALKAMQELSHYVNEVKRDSEMLQTISKVESCLVDYTVQLPLCTYGRLLKDGELKIKTTTDNRPKQRFTYLFDQALFITSIKNETYKLKDLIRLEDYILDDVPQTRAAKWSWHWSLRDKYGSHTYIFCAKSKGDKMKWLENIKNAFETINPNALKGKQHTFKMKTFKEPTYCSHCKKLLLGSFYQGYCCERSNKACHKWCLSETWKSIENAIPDPVSPVDNVSQNSGMYRAHREYSGRPVPPFEGGNYISFNVGEQIVVEERKTAEWWQGRTVTNFDRKGYFPASYVSPAQPHGSGTSRLRQGTSNGSSSVYDVAQPMPSTSVQLEQYYWYAGVLNRDGASQLLEGKPSGTFLVRTRDDQLAISLVFHNETKHIRVINSHNMFYVAECKNFKSVQELVKYYQDNMMNSSFLGLDTTLKYPYRDPKFFPNASRTPGPNHRVSLPGPPPLLHPALIRNQTFSHSIHVDATRRGSEAQNVVTVGGKKFELMGKGKVLYDFEPRSTQELALKANQIVNIISKAGDEHGWWKGEHRGKVGYFPASFVSQVEDHLSNVSAR